MYKLTRFGQSRLALSGVPWRDLSDEEYAKAVEKHPGMEEHGYFVKVVEEAVPEEKPSRRRVSTQEETDG
jgi:hypothetical protein